ncbi:phosphoglycolate phosphatase-like isoform X1 [Brachionus plicatilis]|uniref:Phosphoglycolate phosphatase-like isoform X1 n=1 Tax=Brachionus plicatilis TaxID=10195 RepID=A0A3M7SNJ8_BRAPC|nr:phosphoglycolate phosphatase-like isoform X1 [Brachionus plicatilis]
MRNVWKNFTHFTRPRMPFKQPNCLTQEYATRLIQNVDNFLFDCDGVIWNWPKPIEGAVAFINKLKELKKKCFFITNNSTKTREMVMDLLVKIGISNVVLDDIVCTSWILAQYLKSIDFKDKVYVIGSGAIATELEKESIKHIGIGPNHEQIPDPGKFDYASLIKLDPEVKCVVVAFDHYFNYPKMVIGTSYARRKDCLFIATNDDAQFPTGTSHVIIPGTGSFVNAMKTSVGKNPIILGKPHRTMWEVLEKVHKLDSNRSIIIGDRLDTDIALAANCSLGYSLAVLSGVTDEEMIQDYAKSLESEKLSNDEAKCVPDFYAENLGTFEKFIREHIQFMAEI